MAEEKIRFDDGEAYEQMMGIWSRSVGEIFLDWLAPLPGLRWIDVGCGNGAFTQLLVERCAPAGSAPYWPRDTFSEARDALQHDVAFGMTSHRYSLDLLPDSQTILTPAKGQPETNGPIHQDDSIYPSGRKLFRARHGARSLPLK